MTLWCHHVTSRYMRTTEIEWNSGAVMAPKKTDKAKKRTTDARATHFWVYRF